MQLFMLRHMRQYQAFIIFPLLTRYNSRNLLNKKNDYTLGLPWLRNIVKSSKDKRLHGTKKCNYTKGKTQIIFGQPQVF